MHKDITFPIKSDFVIIEALIKGSSTLSKKEGPGKSEGLFTSIMSSGCFLE